jgi:hypothetical protein
MRKKFRCLINFFTIFHKNLKKKKKFFHFWLLRNKIIFPFHRSENFPWNLLKKKTTLAKVYLNVVTLSMFSLSRGWEIRLKLQYMKMFGSKKKCLLTYKNFIVICFFFHFVAFFMIRMKNMLIAQWLFRKINGDSLRSDEMCYLWCRCWRKFCLTSTVGKTKWQLAVKFIIWEFFKSFSLFIFFTVLLKHNFHFTKFTLTFFWGKLKIIKFCLMIFHWIDWNATTNH